MDADAYLKRLGWRGSGHSLDHHDRGIKKPLLIAHKQDQLGLGTKKAAHKTDDQWWMRAFDQSLQNIGSGKESTLTQIRKSGINRGGLYGFFVRGEGLEGTLSSTEESTAAEASTSNSSAAPTKESTPATSASSASDDSDDSDDNMSVTSTQENSATSKSKKRKRGLEGAEEIRRRQKKPKQDAVTSSVQGLNDEEITKIDVILKRVGRQAKTQAATEARDLTGKKSKYEKGSAIRKATMRIKKQLTAEALASGALPNPKMRRPDQADQYLADMEEVRKRAKEQKKVNRKQQEESANVDGHDDQTRISAHIATLKPKKKAEIEQRAAQKQQSLEQYVLQRLQKQDRKHEGPYSQAPPLFFVDTTADKALVSEAAQLAQEEEERLAEKQARIAKRRKEKTLKNKRIDALAKDILTKERGALHASTAKEHVVKKARKKARKEIKLEKKLGERAEKKKAGKKRLAKRP